MTIKKKKNQKIVNRSNFLSQKIIDKDFVAVHCSLKVELSKLYM